MNYIITILQNYTKAIRTRLKGHTNHRGTNRKHCRKKYALQIPLRNFMQVQVNQIPKENQKSGEFTASKPIVFSISM